MKYGLQYKLLTTNSLNYFTCGPKIKDQYRSPGQTVDDMTKPGPSFQL